MIRFDYVAFTLFDSTSQMILLLIIHLISQSYNPTLCGLGSSHFARRYFGNLVWFLFPGYLDGSLHPVWLYYPILFRYVVHPKMWVTPFGDPRINVYVLLPVAFRSLSRPSSPYSSIGIRHRPIFAWPYYSFRLLKSLSPSVPFLFKLGTSNSLSLIVLH